MQMRRILTFAAALGLIAALTTSPAAAQTFFGGLRLVGPISGASSAADTDIGLYVKYVGTAAGKPTIEVTAAGDLVFVIAGAADTTVGCPTDTGTIDVSDAACNTWGEVINQVNASGSNWRVAPGAILYAGDADGSLLVLAATDVDVRVGKPLYIDSSVDDDIQISVGPPGLAINGSFWFQGNGLNANPFASFVSLLSAFKEQLTNAGTLSAVTIYGVTPKFGPSGAAGVSYSETSRVVWTEAAAATTAENITDFNQFPLVSQPGERFIMVITASGADTSVQAVAVAGALASR
jgi:hypothetical protein